MLQVTENCFWGHSLYIYVCMYVRHNLTRNALLIIGYSQYKVYSDKDGWISRLKIYLWKAASKWPVPKYGWRQTPSKKRNTMVNVNLCSDGTRFESQPEFQLSSLRALFYSVSPDTFCGNIFSTILNHLFSKKLLPIQCKLQPHLLKNITSSVQVTTTSS